jgi:alkylation response protein AidB-like acyl-CoA dehydrogenase
MRFAFSPEQLLFRSSVRALLRAECTPARVRAAWSDNAGQAPEVWSKLCEVGVVGLTVPEEYGGLGLSELDLALLLEETGEVALPDPIVETTAVGVLLLCEAPEGALAARWLAPVAAGKVILAVGLEGAPYVAHAASAQLLLLQRGDELHAVPRERVRLTAQESVDGARKLYSVAWSPEPGTRFADGERGRRLAEAAFDRGALATAAQLCGIARHLIEVTVEYAKVRHQFGKPIGSFQAVKHHLVNALLPLEFARPAVYRAADSMARRHPERSLHVSLAKARASEAALIASRAALQCHGAIGYTQEYDLHLWMKRAWALAGAFGDAAFHRARVGAVILDGTANEISS